MRRCVSGILTMFHHVRETHLILEDRLLGDARFQKQRVCTPVPAFPLRLPTGTVFSSFGEEQVSLEGQVCDSLCLRSELCGRRMKQEMRSQTQYLLGVFRSCGRGKHGRAHHRGKLGLPRVGRARCERVLLDTSAHELKLGVIDRLR